MVSNNGRLVQLDPASPKATIHPDTSDLVSLLYAWFDKQFVALIAESDTNPNLLTALREAGRALSINTPNADALAATINALAARALLYVWNGATWDRAPGTAALGLQVDTELPAASALANGIANPTTSVIGALAELWNGASWDRRTGNIENTDLASAARTTNSQTGSLTNFNSSHMRAFQNVSAVSGTSPTLDTVLQGWDSVSAAFSTEKDSAGNNVAFNQQTGTGGEALRLGPGLIEKLTGANRMYTLVLARTYRWQWSLGGTTPSFTSSIGSVHTP